MREVILIPLFCKSHAVGRWSIFSFQLKQFTLIGTSCHHWIIIFPEFSLSLSIHSLSTSTCYIPSLEKLHDHWSFWIYGWKDLIIAFNLSSSRTSSSEEGINLQSYIASLNLTRSYSLLRLCLSNFNNSRKSSLRVESPINLSNQNNVLSSAPTCFLNTSLMLSPKILLITLYTNHIIPNAT